MRPAPPGFRRAREAPGRRAGRSRRRRQAFSVLISSGESLLAWGGRLRCNVLRLSSENAGSGSRARRTPLTVVPASAGTTIVWRFDTRRIVDFQTGVDTLPRSRRTFFARGLLVSPALSEKRAQGMPGAR